MRVNPFRRPSFDQLLERNGVNVACPNSMASNKKSLVSDTAGWPLEPRVLLRAKDASLASIEDSFALPNGSCRRLMRIEVPVKPMVMRVAPVSC